MIESALEVVLSKQVLELVIEHEWFFVLSLSSFSYFHSKYLVIGW